MKRAKTQASSRAKPTKATKPDRQWYRVGDRLFGTLEQAHTEYDRTKGK